MTLFLAQSFNMVHQRNQQQFSRMLPSGVDGGSTIVWGNGIIDAAEEWGILFCIFTSMGFHIIFEKSW